MQKYQNQFELHSICADIYQWMHMCDGINNNNSINKKKTLELSVLKIGKINRTEYFFYVFYFANKP